MSQELSLWIGPGMDFANPCTLWGSPHYGDPLTYGISTPSSG